MLNEVKIDYITTSKYSKKQIKLFVDPSPDQLTKIIINIEIKKGTKPISGDEDRFETLRGYVTNSGDVIFWDADDAIHDEVVEGYGDVYHRNESLFVTIDGKLEVAKIHRAYMIKYPSASKTILQKRYRKLLDF